MLSYKLICIDMDGTLLNTDNDISENTIAAIKKATALGINVAVSTGRLFVSAKYYADKIGINTPIIASNGSYIRNRTTDEIRYKKILGIDNCKKVLSILKEYNMYPHFNTYNKIFTEKIIYSSEYYTRMNKLLPVEKRIDIELVSNWDDIFNLYSDEILKCIVSDDDIEKVKKVKTIVAKETGLEVVSSFENNFEIMAKGVSKGRAVEFLAKTYGISKEEVICIGDSENDFSMINYAGLGVAMGNAAQLIKENANYITDTNDEDGVAKVIEKFVL